MRQKVKSEVANTKWESYGKKLNKRRGFEQLAFSKLSFLGFFLFKTIYLFRNLFCEKQQCNPHSCHSLNPGSDPAGVKSSESRRFSWIIKEVLLSVPRLSRIYHWRVTCDHLSTLKQHFYVTWEQMEIRREIREASSSSSVTVWSNNTSVDQEVIIHRCWRVNPVMRGSKWHPGL